MTGDLTPCPDPEDHALVEDLRRAVESNRVIGAAVGIIMVRHLLTYEQALETLRTASARLNRRVVELAAETVETGAAPSVLTAAGNSRGTSTRPRGRRPRGGHRDPDLVEPDRLAAEA